jgi:hypothetical protein
MEDRIYQDPFDLEFPEITESDELLEAKGTLSEQVKSFVEELLPALKKASFVPRDGKLGKLDKDFLDTLGDRGRKAETYRIMLWSKCQLVICPTLTSDGLGTPRVIGSGNFETLKQEAVKIWQKDAHKALTKAIPLPKQFKGSFYSNKFPVPAFVCLEPKDCISQELYDQIKSYTKLPRLKDFGTLFADTALKNAIVIGCYFLEDKEPVLRLATEVRQAFCNGLPSELINLPGVRRELDRADALEGTDPGTPVDIESEETEESEPSEVAEVSETSKTDRFETEEFKSELKEIGFTDAQIERLYKSGALKVIAAINLDDIDEGEESHE